MKKIVNVENKLKLKLKAKKELLRLEKLNKDKELIEKIDIYKNKFEMCEIVYKIICKEWLNDEKNQNYEYIKIHLSQVKYSLLYTGYEFDINVISKLFGTNQVKGKKSVKSLRDDLTHKISKSAIDELFNREEELHGYMDYFISLIKNAA